LSLGCALQLRTIILNNRKKTLVYEFITLLTAILRIVSHIENRKNDKGYII